MARIVEKILEVIQAQVENTGDLLDIVCSDRTTSYKKARRSFWYGPREFKTDWAEWYRQRQAFYSLLNQLKRDGLVQKNKSGRMSSWGITSQGRIHLTKIKMRAMRKQKDQKRNVILPKKSYEKKGVQTTVTIVAFDIPERERRKRDWLRGCLISLGFAQLQKSVWMGKVLIPEAFIHDLRTLRMSDYVHIFSLGARGTLVTLFGENKD